MENTKTTELRRRKSSVKAKLMSAVAMLLVSVIMLSSSTYAWFVLSTAPEVKGMSTTVGANGSLEIALLNDSTDTALITSGVGDSSAIQDVTAANITWGNLVDLSSTAYGLQNTKLYPAALNFAAGANDRLASPYSMLQYPVYGLDGRVAQLNADTEAGKYDGGVFKADARYYGVRVVGSADDADPLALAFRQSKERYANSMLAARDEAVRSLKANGDVLMELARIHSANRDATFTEEDVQAIRDALAGVQKAADQLKLAIQNAYRAYLLADGGDASTEASSLNIEEFTAMADQVAAYKQLQADIDAAAAPITPSNEDGSYSWNDISVAMRALVDSDNMKMNGKTFEDLQDLMNRVNADNSLTEEETAWLNEMIDNKTANAEIGSGLYSQVADFVDDYSVNDLKVVVPFKGINMTITVTLVVHKSVPEAYKVPMGNVIDGFDSPSGSSTAVINTPYGYVIDLAFRCNADTTLTLSTAARRVSSDEEDKTMGGGSIFTVTQAGVAEADMQKLAKALRVVFVQNDPAGTNYQILGVAGLAASNEALTANAENKYELHMYDYAVDANGGIKLNAQKTDDSITELVADQAQCISALVYLDGNYVDYAMNGVEGALNLQFGSTAELRPMEYSGYVEPTTSSGGEEGTPDTPAPEAP